MTLGALEPKFWFAFCKATGLEADATALLPGPHQEALKAKVATLFRTKTRAEWEAFPREHDVCHEPVLSPDEARADAHLAARDTFFTLDSPWGPIPQFRTPLGDARAPHRPPPRPGEHTDEILRECGAMLA
jgi:crotonobetainyl-CoA:carnitine CoA-transferase CaiB-like acyl-CoA transferase